MNMVECQVIAFMQFLPVAGSIKRPTEKPFFRLILDPASCRGSVMPVAGGRIGNGRELEHRRTVG